MIRVVRTAFVLGAGLGTRLRPLTNRRPKPLIPVVNRPLVAHTFDRLRAQSIETYIVNTHWAAEAWSVAFPDPGYRGVPIDFREEKPDVLETAGGIKNVEDLLGAEPFIVHNGDILTDLPLREALGFHVESGNEVTLVLRSKDGPLQIAFDEASGRIADIGKCLHPDIEPRFLFTGIYIVQPEFLRRIPAHTKISVVPIFCDMIRAGAKLGGILIDEGNWWDLGTREQYLAVHRWLAENNARNANWIDPSAKISATAKIAGATAIGANAIIGEGARLTDCLVWENAEVAPGAVLERCIITDGARAEGVHRDRDFA